MIRNTTTAFVFLSSLAASTALAHDVCYEGATVFPVSAPEFIGTVCTTGERISGLYPLCESFAADRVVSADGAVITPGLIEASTSLGLI